MLPGCETCFGVAILDRSIGKYSTLLQIDIMHQPFFSPNIRCTFFFISESHGGQHCWNIGNLHPGDFPRCLFWNNCSRWSQSNAYRSFRKLKWNPILLESETQTSQPTKLVRILRIQFVVVQTSLVKFSCEIFWSKNHVNTQKWLIILV